MDTDRRGSERTRGERWILVLSAALAVGWAAQRLVPDDGGSGPSLGPDWLPLAAAVVASVGLLPRESPSWWRRVQRPLRWAGLLLLVWTANGLPFDLLTAAGLIGRPGPDGSIVIASAYWPGMATRVIALAATVMLGRLLLVRPGDAAPRQGARWYGYLAFVLALPYPVLRAHWALGGSLGLTEAGAGGEGMAPLLLAIPWVLAAVVSLLLASPPVWFPRRLLIGAGWLGTLIVATIGPSACWAVVDAFLRGDELAAAGIEGWVFALFYGSWMFWAVAAGAATYALQRRTPPPAPDHRPGPWTTGGHPYEAGRPS